MVHSDEQSEEQTHPGVQEKNIQEQTLKSCSFRNSEALSPSVLSLESRQLFTQCPPSPSGSWREWKGTGYPSFLQGITSNNAIISTMAFQILAWLKGNWPYIRNQKLRQSMEQSIYFLSHISSCKSAMVKLTSAIHLKLTLSRKPGMFSMMQKT